MAAKVFKQTNTVAPSGAIAACSGAILAPTPVARLASVGGTAGTTPANASPRATRATVMFELAPGQSGWSAGNWTVRLNVTGANANVTWTETYICRRTSGGVPVTFWSNTGSISFATTGVKSMQVTGTAHNGNDTDIAYIVLVMTTPGATETFTFTPNQDIDSPILEAITGGIDANLPGFSAELEGTPIVAGAIDADLPGFLAELDGSPIVAGAIDAELPGFSADVEGTPITAASIAADLPGFSAELEGTPIVAGAIDADLPGFLAEARGAGAVPEPIEAVLAPGWIDGLELDGSAAAAAELYATADVDDATYEAGYLGGAALASRAGDVRLVTPTLNPASTWGVNIRVKASAPVERRLVGLWYGDPDDAGMLEAELVLVPVGDGGVRWRLEVRGGNGTVLGASRSMGAEGWTLVGFGVTLGDSRFGAVELRLNGLRVLSLSGVEVRSGSSGGVADTVEVGVESDGSEDSWALVDDIAVLSYLTANRIARAVLPEAAGDVTGWTPSAGENHEAVDETPGTDEDASYVSTSGAGGTVDLYRMSKPSGALGNALEAVRYDVAARVTTGSATVGVRARSEEAEDATLVEEVVTSTSFVRIRATTIVSPYNGGRLERADTDAQQVGVEA